MDDLVENMIRLMNGQHTGPINIGNPGEFTFRQLAELLRSKINLDLPLIKKPLPAADPLQRQPVVELAQKELGWQPTIAWFKSLLDEPT
jgi:UDP-glucuronate decarboxylase